jgi:hypothetical protein
MQKIVIVGRCTYSLLHVVSDIFEFSAFSRYIILRCICSGLHLVWRDKIVKQRI